MLKKHQDILWLAGQVLLSRNFVTEVETHNLESIFALCPYGDLTEQEKTVFRSAFKDEKLRHVIEQWWAVYDEERQAGIVPQVEQLWDT
jgi:hypothetical protein